MKVKNPIMKDMAKINSTKSSGTSLNSLAKSKSSKGLASTAGGSSSSRVNLSSRAQQMSKAKEIASEPSFNAAKVNRLQKMIDEGKYNVDASAVADRLVDNHLIFGE